MATFPVVYNVCYGGYDIPKKVARLYIQKCIAAGVDPAPHPARDDPILAEAVQQLGDQARSFATYLRVAQVPIEYADCYRIDEYDGMESVVCDPKDLIASKLYDLDVSKLTDPECRAMLEELVKLAGNS
jgi:hypothetical protein